MFNSRKVPLIRTVVGEGTAIHGELRFSQGLRIEGEVHGDVIAEGGAGGVSILVIGEKGRVIGKVKAGHVIINGSIKGPVECDELLELQSTALIEGDVRYHSLEMHPGATIEGVLRPFRLDERAPVIQLASSAA